MLKSALPCLLLSLAGTVQAADVYGGIGTTGFLIGMEQHFNEAVGVRADLNLLSLSRSASDSSATYQGNLHLTDLGLFADYHPWANGFRLSAGALIGDSYLNGSAVATNGVFTLNGVSVNAAGQTLDAKIRFPGVRPVLGLGWGHAPKATGTFVSFDLGIAYGRPDASLSASPGLVQAATLAGTSVEAERQVLQQKANDFRIYPIARANLGWAW